MILKYGKVLLSIFLLSIMLTACGENTVNVDTNDSIVEEATANIPPIAKAGSPKTKVNAGQTVEFSSRLSNDPDGVIVERKWLENGRVVARVPYFFKVYNIPGTYKIKLIVTDDDGASTSTQYNIFVKAYKKSFTNNMVINITDNTIIDSDIPASNATPSISKLVVKVDIAHTWVGDITISLRSPTGTVINLIDRHGVPADVFGTSGDNFTNTIFDDDASVTIESGNPPFTGSFIPEQPLANFTGENPNGVWTLSVNDQAGGDIGTLNSWTMIIE